MASIVVGTNVHARTGLLYRSGRIGSDGSHLAATLFRMAQHDPEDTYAVVATEAAMLADTREVWIDADPHRETLTLQAKIGDGPSLPARALSDGTLRFLALCIISADPSFGGLLCMEEPENGIHPAKISAIVNLVRGLAVDPSDEPDAENPLRQVMVNTHSPYYVQLQNRDDLLLAVPASIVRDGVKTITTRFVPLDRTWRADRSDVASVSLQTILDYLQQPPNAQLMLPADWGAA